MAEFAATIVGIAGVVSVTKDVCDIATGLQEYYKQVKSAHDDINALTLQLNTNLETFQQLDKLYQSSQFPLQFDSFNAGSALRSAIDRYTAQLRTLKTSLTGISSKISGNSAGNSNVSALYGRITWPFRHKEFRAVIQNIQLYEQLFHSALTIDGSKLLAKTSTEVVAILDQQQTLASEVKSVAAVLNLLKDLPADVLELKLSLQSLQVKEQSALSTKALQWLSPVSMLQTLDDVITRRALGTSTWILQHPTYEEWKSRRQQPNRNPSLWCHGNPGVGKTILAATVVEDLLQTCLNPQDVVLYYFCDYRNEQQRRAGLLIQSLTRQLGEALLARGESISELEVLHRELKDGKRTPNLSETSMLFEAFLKKGSNVMVVIDALDECASMDDRETICQFLFDMQKRNSTMASLVTSRPNFEDINILFESVPSINVSGLQSDIEICVAARLRQNLLFHKRVAKVNGLLEEIRDSIVKYSGSIFLIAVLQTEWVMHHRTVDQIRNALSTLPERMEDAYARNMERVMDQPAPDQRLCLRAMLWIVTATRPLNINELVQALAFSRDGGTPKLSEGDMLPIEDVLTICGGLVVVDEESQTIRMLHYTTQAYLVKHYQTLFKTVFEEGFTSLDGQVASDCLACLSLQAQPMFKNLDTYIADFIGHHLQKSSPAEYPGLVHLGLSILTNDEHLSRLKMIIPLLDDEAAGCYDQHYIDPMSRSRLHIATRWGFIPLIEALCDTGCRLDVEDGNQNTPLNIAVYTRQPKVVKCLLDRGCNAGVTRPRIAGGIEWWEGCTPVLDAYKTKDVEIFGLLLDKLKSVDEKIFGWNNWNGSNFKSTIITPRRLNKKVGPYMEMFSLLAKRLARAPDQELKALLHYMIEHNMWELVVETLSPTNPSMNQSRQQYLLSEHLSCGHLCQYLSSSPCGGMTNRARLDNIKYHLNLSTS